MNQRTDTYAKGIIIAVFSEILFGLSFIFIRLCVGTVSVFTLLAWRTMMAFVIMTACGVLGIVKINLRGKNLKPLLILSLFQPVLYYVMETLGVQRTTAAESGVLLACIPMITMLFSAVFLKDKPTKPQILCMVVTVLGAVMIGIGGELQTSSSFLGYLFLLIAMCSESAYAITSQHIKGFNSAEKTYAMIVSGAVVFTGCALVEHGMNGTLTAFLTLPLHDTGFFICILYLSLGCNLIAFLCANYSISIIGATKRAAFASIASVTSVLGGVFYLGESFTKIQIAATVLVLLGVYGVNRFGKKAETD